MRQSRPASSSPEDGRRIILPPVRLQDEADRAGRRSEFQDSRPGNGSQSVIQHHPSEDSTSLYNAQTTSGSGTYNTLLPTSRSLGVHTILNPSEPDRDFESSRSAQAAQTQSPHLTQTSFQPRDNTLVAAQGQGHGQQPSGSLASAEGNAGYASGRKILQPKSPRSVSFGVRQATGAEGQQASSVPTAGRGFASEQAPPFSTGISSMPRVSGPPNIQAADPSADLRRRVSVATMSAPSRAPLSQSTSPSPSLTSSYSSQPSPATRQQLGQPSNLLPYFPGASFGAPIPGSAQGPHGSEGPYLPPDNVYAGGSPGPPGQSSNFKMMSIPAEGGGHFYVPVDVQAASKMADEKRARNAGASARFRERKKAKEREASTNIQRLEQQSKDLERKARELEQERDYYRGERDRFRDIVFRNPATRELATQGPPSPRSARMQIRAPTFAPPPQPSGASGYADSSSVGGGISQEKEISERVARRRRTDTQGDYTYSPLMSTLPPVQQSTGYGLSQPLANLPPLRMENVGPPGGSRGGSYAGPSAPSSNRPPYESTSKNVYDRSWGSRPEDRPQ